MRQQNITLVYVDFIIIRVHFDLFNIEDILVLQETTVKWLLMSQDNKKTNKWWKRSCFYRGLSHNWSWFKTPKSSQIAPTTPWASLIKVYQAEAPLADALLGPLHGPPPLRSQGTEPTSSINLNSSTELDIKRQMLYMSNTPSNICFSLTHVVPDSPNTLTSKAMHSG